MNFHFPCATKQVRGVKIPNKLLALHVLNFSPRCCKLESTTQIVKLLLALHNIFTKALSLGPVPDL